MRAFRCPECLMVLRLLVTIDTKMLEPFIHDTSSLQDRLLMRSMAEDNKAIGNGAGYSGPKGSKL
ncbi:hypothetical protein FOCG_05594 [Fusarium oxysporum f. sp. radicis-lycopersici 26381]|uniref:Uncharacterized protein n=4 Tax=Fusarium oxysporum TaxID=5507 RepID=W9HX52_FUSOX|nr:hypothetical protein FOXG_21267 [Fusarium oxysporum f. sp. lycopersici 4287]EWY84806.1 hypothetical protein FOYG_12183 [Fusarium oxysporum NRRL 32931]EWZ35256.1 hypothetical protein FOZG_11259 [Fusarium oxysporum Fo47]EWZ96753.1 hypothetical protein FOWG_04027 [Fusarium oxysporum f. sp. lycopersici MN25]EXK34919.1 hypothetical protein FOMG_10234 [Fusarium oxysporum f. sp. melonis 26406]EXL54792.1 hypothetical protein FOCG_05594 [Fusarium oxysporum f. sp. radicis-lycopersici 26381]